MKVLHMTRPHQENGLYFLTSEILPIVDEHNQPCIYKLKLGPDHDKVTVYHLHPKNMDALRSYIFRIIKQNDILLINFRETEMAKHPGYYFISGNFKDWRKDVQIDPPLDEHGNFLLNSDKPDQPDDV